MQPDIKIHTGATMSLGKGLMYSVLVRQNLNTRISTEADMVGIYHVVTIISWIKYLLDAQAHSIGTYILQDKQSYMLLDNNGSA